MSLIVLNWNGKHHLDSCLSSLLAQDYPGSNLEIILADNGSTDGSTDYVKGRFPDVRSVAFDRNHGFAQGNNLAAKEARSEWLGFLNNDMWIEPTWLSRMFEMLTDHPHTSCIASRIMNWDGSAIDFIGGGMNYQGHGFQVDQGQTVSARDVERRVLFACGGAMLIRRDVFNHVEGFDADYFAFFEDVDLGWRLNLLGFEVWYTPRATAYHRHHGSASRLPPHKLQLLYERNALFSIYKCYSDDTLARVLPTALMLINERGLRTAGVDNGEFQLGPIEACLTPNTGPSHEPPWVRARRVLTEQGHMLALRKTLRWSRDRLRDLGHQVVGRIPYIWGRATMPQMDLVVWPSLSASHYVAISEFAHSLERLQVKRDWLQERRTVSDHSLIHMFEDPFFPNFHEERYLRFYRWITNVQGLDTHFASESD